MKFKFATDSLCVFPPRIGSAGRRIVCCLMLLLLWSLPAAAFSAEKSEDAAPLPELPLKAASDAAIEKRLQSIIDNIDEFHRVKIDVKDGVVRLSGKTPRAEAAEKVAQMVGRFEGVIYVDNQIQVETDVEARVKPSISRIKQWLNGILQKLPIIGVALAVIVAFWLLSRFVTRWEFPYQRLGWNRLLRNLIRQFLRKGIFLVGVLLAFDILDLTALVGAMLGTVGVVGIALGFAFKDIVENYLAGLLLSIRRPFDVNDLISIESHEGRVVRLTSSELVLMTLDGNHVRIPNATVYKTFIYNYSINPRRRFDFGIGVGANEDLVDVQKLGCDILRSMKGVMTDPAPFMIVEDLGDYNVLVRFYGWVDQRSADFAKVRGEAIRRVKLGLDKAEISMPEPVQTVRWQQVAKAPPKPASFSQDLAEKAVEKEKKTVDVSPDTQLDDQITEDLAGSDAPNLLTDA